MRSMCLVVEVTSRVLSAEEKKRMESRCRCGECAGRGNPLLGTSSLHHVYKGSCFANEAWLKIERRRAEGRGPERASFPSNGVFILDVAVRLLVEMCSQSLLGRRVLHSDGEPQVRTAIEEPD